MAAPTRRRQGLELDALAAHWQRALDAAQGALGAAHGELSDLELARRAHALVAERQLTAALLTGLAEAASVPPPWLSPVLLRPELLGLQPGVRACLFDLEGVLTDGAALHAEAWGEAFDELLRHLGERAGWVPAPFDRDADYRAFVEGRPRLEGVLTFLRSRGIRLPQGQADDPPEFETAHGLARRKSEALTRRLERQGVTALPGARRYLDAAGRVGIARAVLSASVRTGVMLELAGLAPLVEERVDADRVRAEGIRSRPAPDALLSACRGLRTEPRDAVALTSSPLGVEAGRAAGVEVIGVGHGASAERLRGAGAARVVVSLAALLDVRLTAGL
jgi:beta-phosphoglucomutase-like phosphatase (HAD superfamily)